MSIADNIKRAALGRAPRNYKLISLWMSGDKDAFDAVLVHVFNRDGWYDDGHTIDERRMFLLFVAYSLGAK